MRKALAIAALLLVSATPAYAGDGGGYWIPGTPAIDIDAQSCRTHTWVNEAGKTPNGSHAVATDGCHTYDFTTSIGVEPASGEAVFKTSAAAQGREADSALADAAPNHCAFAAIAASNMAFVNYFGVQDGTEVRVKYSCE